MRAERYNKFKKYKTHLFASWDWDLSNHELKTVNKKYLIRQY